MTIAAAPAGWRSARRAGCARSLLIAALVAVVPCLSPGAARAGDEASRRERDGARPAPAPERIYLRFDGPWPPRVTALVESDLRTAFGRRRVDVHADRRGARGPRHALLTLTTAGEALARVTLTLETDGEMTLSRRLDLGRFPDDGRVLALVVAADELLQVAREPPAREPLAPPEPLSPPPPRAATPAVARAVAPPAVPRPAPPAPAPVAPPPAATASPGPAAPPPALAITLPEEAVPPAAPAQEVPAIERQPSDAAGARGEPRAGTLALTFAFDSYGGGQSQLGPEITWRGRVGSNLIASIAAGARQGLTDQAKAGTFTSRLLGGRLALGARLLSAAGRLSLTVDAGVRGAGLWFDAHPGADTPARVQAVATFVAYADVMLALDLRLWRALAARASVGGGVPLLAQTASEEGTGAATGASGGLFEAQLGAVLIF